LSAKFILAGRLRPFSIFQILFSGETLEPVAFENGKSTPGNHSKIKERIDTGN